MFGIAGSLFAPTSNALTQRSRPPHSNLAYKLSGLDLGGRCKPSAQPPSKPRVDAGTLSEALRNSKRVRPANASPAEQVERTASRRSQVASTYAGSHRSLAGDVAVKEGQAAVAAVERARAGAKRFAPQMLSYKQGAHSVRANFRMKFSWGEQDWVGRHTESYTAFAGNRFPTLNTRRNWRYFQPRGRMWIGQLGMRAPLTVLDVPEHLRINKYLREYIGWLRSANPARFTVARIAERYHLKEATVELVAREFARGQFLARSGLTDRLHSKRVAQELMKMKAKAQDYMRLAGPDHIGDGGDEDGGLETPIESWDRDVVKQYETEVSMLSAYPTALQYREPRKRRHDVDIEVGGDRRVKIIHWIDPTEKVVF